MVINSSVTPDSSALTKNQTAPTKASATTAVASAESSAAAATAQFGASLTSSSNQLSPTADQLFASVMNFNDPDEAQQATNSASNTILSQSNLALQAQANLDPGSVFQLLLE
jgi:flagellin-like hook-associated protein FlgL